jgi:hypothetical protein
VDTAAAVADASVSSLTSAEQIAVLIAVAAFAAPLYIFRTRKEMDAQIDQVFVQLDDFQQVAARQGNIANVRIGRLSVPIIWATLCYMLGTHMLIFAFFYSVV